MPLTLIRGRVLTADPERPYAEALVFDEAGIRFVGDRDSVPDTGHDTRVIDADGLVLPGFVDGHAHLLATGQALLQAQLRDAKDLEEIGHRLRAWRDANVGAPRVLGLGWLFSAVPSGTPTRHMLDAFVTDIPVYLDAADFHSVWVNGAALAEMGITDDTPDPIGGRIVRDPAGKATGLLLESAGYALAWPYSHAVDESERRRVIDSVQAAYLAAGTTAAVDMAMDASALGALLEAEAEGRLRMHVSCHWLIERGDPAHELDQVRQAIDLARHHRTGRVRVVGIKIVSDGTIDGCTAALLAPYGPEALERMVEGDACGTPIWPRDALDPVIAEADAAGLQVAVHAIGDAAVRTALDSFEAAALRTRQNRHRIEHLEYVDDADLPRLAELGVTASMQPVHCDPAIMDNWRRMLGDERGERGFRWRDHLEAGAVLAFGTDTPTADLRPLPNMFTAATRRSAADPALPAYLPEQALELAAAIRHATAVPAWASRMEAERGMLREGLAADVVVLDRDPIAGGPESLLSARVQQTFAAGAVV